MVLNPLASKPNQPVTADILEQVRGQEQRTEPGHLQTTMFDERSGEASFLLNVLSTSSSVRLPGPPGLLLENGPHQHLKAALLRTSPQAGCDPRMTACREPVTSATLQKQINCQRCELPKFPILETFTSIDNVCRPSEVEWSQADGGYGLEDADDPPAILVFSDEEEKSNVFACSESVCHAGSPRPDLVHETFFEPTSRRKRECEDLDEEEVQSRFSKRQKSEGKLEETDVLPECSSPEVSIFGSVSEESQPLYEGLKYGEDCCLDQSADELQMLCDDFGFEMPEQQCSSCSKEGGGGDSLSFGSARQSRRQKIKATVKLLREAIPGGECMDTAIVLDEAIHYVQMLQLQVRTLGAKRLAQRAAR